MVGQDLYHQAIKLSETCVSIMPGIGFLFLFLFFSYFLITLQSLRYYVQDSVFEMYLAGVPFPTTNPVHFKRVPKRAAPSRYDISCCPLWSSPFHSLHRPLIARLPATSSRIFILEHCWPAWSIAVVAVTYSQLRGSLQLTLVEPLSVTQPPSTSSRCDLYDSSPRPNLNKTRRISPTARGSRERSCNFGTAQYVQLPHPHPEHLWLLHHRRLHPRLLHRCNRPLRRSQPQRCALHQQCSSVC